jgi:hypothetical protein
VRMPELLPPPCVPWGRDPGGDAPVMPSTLGEPVEPPE